LYTSMSMDLQRVLQQALDYLQSGLPEKCTQLCNEILAENPGLIQALYLRGCAAFKCGDMARSLNDLEIVHSNHPEHLHAAYYFGRSLRASGNLEGALVPLRSALDEKEIEVNVRYELATCLTGLRRRPEAIDHYQAILGLQPGNAQVAANLASLLERENRLDEAESWTSKALLMDPSSETALMTRATLDRRGGKYPQAVQRLQGLIKQIDNPINHSLAWNQLGQCFEGQAEWDAAFKAFSKSNRILKRYHPHSNPDPLGPHGLQTLARIHTWLKESPMPGWTESAIPDAGGIAFLVGFPRSGTTLLDRMLSAHPDVEVLEEKSLFSKLHQDWSQPGTLEALIYRQEISRHRRQPQRPLVIDKLPLNLAYLFLINRLFPEAPVVFLQRHPLDVCLSCYFQAFELEASMAYFLDIEETAQYYNAVMQVATLSIEQISNPVHQLRYEDLVAAPGDQLKVLLNFLNLKWDNAVLDYRQQAATDTSNTPSYQQVVQPLHSRSVGKWQHYPGQLESSLSVLAPWMKHLGYQETSTGKSSG